MTDAAAPADPLVLFVHGAWHGAWCWATLQARLDALGIASMAIDLPGHGASLLPLGDLWTDAQHVADVVHVLQRPVVLVGHSYGGAVITEAAVRITTPVAHLVYLAAFALDQDESIMGLLGSLPRESVLLSGAMEMRDDGTSVLDPAAAGAALYGSCAEPVVTAALSRLSPQPMATFGQPVTGAPRFTVPSTYVVCSLDRAIAPAHQAAMAQRCTHSLTLQTDHSPFVSLPDATAAIVADVVRGPAVSDQP